MKIRFFCSCGKEYKVEEDKIGKKTKCIACEKPLLIPEESQEDIVVRCQECRKLFEALPYLLNKESECPACACIVPIVPKGKEEDALLYNDGSLDQEEFSYDFKDPVGMDQDYCNFCRVEIEEGEEVCHSCGHKTKARSYDMKASLPKIGKSAIRNARMTNRREQQKQRQESKKAAPSAQAGTAKAPAAQPSEAKTAQAKPASGIKAGVPTPKKRSSAARMRRKRFR